MVVNITVNGQKINRDELKNITLKNDVVNRIMQDVVKRQGELSKNRKKKAGQEKIYQILKLLCNILHLEATGIAIYEDKCYNISKNILLSKTV